MSLHVYWNKKNISIRNIWLLENVSHIFSVQLQYFIFFKTKALCTIIPLCIDINTSWSFLSDLTLLSISCVWWHPPFNYPTHLYICAPPTPYQLIRSDGSFVHTTISHQITTHKLKILFIDGGIFKNIFK